MARYLSIDGILIIGEAATEAPIAVRDWGLLDSALHRPATTVFGADAYPALLDKAAALLHSLTANHAMVDGNKRTAWLAAVVFLRDSGAEVMVEDGYDGPAARLVLPIADATLREMSEIADRLREMVRLHG